MRIRFAATTLALAAGLLAQQPAKTLRVFLLAGQSNMEGHGVADLDDPRDYNGGRGNLRTFLATAAGRAEFADLAATDGRWPERDDVFVTYLTMHGERKVGPLSVGFGAYQGKHHLGPELGIGRVLGDRFDEPVLLVKTAWGGKSLAVDLRPPSAEGDTGPFYVQMLAEYRAALAALATDHPKLAGYTPRLDGVVWFQGWNDACDRAATASYDQNLPLLIADLRTEFADAALPFVVGETGNWDGADFRLAQLRGTRAPTIAANTRFVATRQFLRPAEQSPNTTHGHHWYGNAESYLRAGDAMGRAMAGIHAARTPPTIPEGEDPLRWQKEIDAMPEPTAVSRPIVFVGSSSIRLWKTLAADMAPMPTITRGFGGSRIFDSIYWADRLIARFDPAAIVVFAGTNDIAGDTPRSADWVAARFDELVARLRLLGCEAPLVYIALTPTPSRKQHLAIVQEANRLIAERCAKDPRLTFVDTAKGMVTPEGQPDPRWFVGDMLHLNADGYRHWTACIRPVLDNLFSSSTK